MSLNECREQRFGIIIRRFNRLGKRLSQGIQFMLGGSQLRPQKSKVSYPRGFSDMAGSGRVEHCIARRDVFALGKISETKIQDAV